MAFSFGNPSLGATAARAGGSAQNGPDLEDITTEALRFLALSGEAKVQLLPTPWPSDQLPPPTASLMSVASHKGLVAAAGPDAVIVATTESVRKAFDGPESGDGHVKPFQPQLKLPMPMRISQLAFSADESYLVLSAENGGGLAVYEVQALLQGNTQSAFELSTNGQALRALTPNPGSEKCELFAVVTTDGNLMMANLKERNFIQGPNGQVLKDGVSCISWSTKGKQLVAGLGNGTAYLMTPEGAEKGDIPKPPNVSDGDHVSSITWLENNVFLMVHTPSSFDSSQAPNSSFHLVSRQLPSSFTFHKISDPAGPFGLNRSPPHHFLLRLRDFPPNLQDMIIVASTASAGIGLFSRSKVPLASDKPADKITEVFTMTEMSDDSHRALFPMTGDLGDTSPIGLALDLSSKEKIAKPIPGDEMDESPTPLPALMVLNNEGVLASWWIIYSESIRQGTIYSGLVVAEGTAPTQTSQAPAQSQTSAFGGPPKPAFGTSTFGSQPAASAFGGSRPTTSFGAPSLPGSSTGAFGAPSGLGQKQSPWGTPSTSNAAPSSGAIFGSSAFGSTPSAPSSTSAFGSTTSAPSSTRTFGPTSSAPNSTPAFEAPAFGSTSIPAFGSSGLPGARPSPWATAGSSTSGPAFGQPSELSKPTSVFGSSAPSTGTTAPSSGGFAGFATGGGFAAASAAAPSGGSIFGAKPAPSPFSAPSTTSPFNTGSADSAFNSTLNKTESKPANPFGSSNFVLGSTFKADPSAKDDAPEPSGESRGSFFGGGFGTALGDAAETSAAEAPVSKETDMDSTDDVSKPEEPPKADSTTPASTPAPAKPGFFSSTPSSGGLFGTPASSASPATKPPASTGFSFGQPPADKPKSGGFNFGNLGITSMPGPKTPTPSDVPPPLTKTPSSPKIKEEPLPETPKVSDKIPEAPLPPDTTSKDSYAAGETSGSSTATSAPLPPDFIPKPAPKPRQVPPPGVPDEPSKKPITADLIPPSDVPGGPEHEGDSSSFLTEEEDDGEGEDEGEDQSGQSSEEASEEGSGEDVAQDLSPTSEINQTPGFTPQSSFGGLKTRPSESTMFTKIQKPGQADPQRSLFGEINRSAPIFPPPKVQGSPRSPSPVRSALPGRLLRPDASRSVSAPGVASQLLGSQRLPGRTPAQSAKTFTLSMEEQIAAENNRAEIRARKETEETQALVDDEDEMTQKFLASEITGTRTLDEFVAHSDYVGHTSMDSIPAQVETVYRDINSMIDTLGLNARALKSFVKGHTEQYKDQGRTREDLEDEEDWCLVEIENLSSLVEKDLTRELEGGRVKEVAQKLETCNDLQKDLIRLRAKHDDIKKIIDSHRDSSHLAIARAQPLSAEQAAQQHDLRRDFMKFQKLLSEAEEGLTVLKTKIVSQATSNGKGNGSAGPTVEAVMRTITKMTSMAEKRSGDIDVLEGQMRKLRFSSTASVGSREGSPFATPQNNRTSLRNPGTSSTYGLFYTPDSIKDNPRGFRSSLMSSITSHGISSPPRKKMSGFSAEEKAQLKSKLARRKEVTNRLRAALQKAGANVRLMDDDE